MVASDPGNVLVVDQEMVLDHQVARMSYNPTYRRMNKSKESRKDANQHLFCFPCNIQTEFTTQKAHCQNENTYLGRSPILGTLRRLERN